MYSKVVKALTTEMAIAAQPMSLNGFTFTPP